MTILEYSERPRASQALQQKVSEREDMKVLTQTTIDEFRGNGKLSSIVVRDLTTGRTREMQPAAVFVFIGVRPNTGFLEGVVDLDAYGFVATRPNLETNRPGVFATGDCRSGSTKQVAGAVGEGATVALMVREYLQRKGETARVSVAE